MPRPWYVYYLVNDEGCPVYIGVSKSPGTRLASHQRNDWFDEEVAYIEMWRYDTEEEARKQERYDVRTLCPTRNTYHQRKEHVRSDPKTRRGERLPA